MRISLIAVNKIIKKVQETGAHKRKKRTRRKKFRTRFKPFKVFVYICIYILHNEISGPQTNPCSIRTVQRALYEMGLECRSLAENHCSHG